MARVYHIIQHHETIVPQGLHGNPEMFRAQRSVA
jgi:hypothetical protein